MDKLIVKTKEASLKDTAVVYSLVLQGKKEGLLLKRTKKEIRQRIKEGGVILAYIDETIIGICILDFYSKRLSELRSLFVSPEYRNSGAGSALVKAIFAKAREKKVKELLTITTKEMAPWFAGHGFNTDAHNFKVSLFKEL